MFKNFRLAKYQLTLQAEEILSLPQYKGSTLRGAFGITFRRLCCVNKRNETCKTCPLKDKCVYTYIFETSPPADSRKLTKLTEIPRPFVIEPSLDNKTEYLPGEILEFNLILIGKAIDHLPYFIFTFKEMGKTGLGKNRGKYRLVQITDASGEIVYSNNDEVIRNINSKLSSDKILNSFPASSNNSELTLSFLTPTRIKFQNDLVVNPEFHILLRSLLHRITALSYFHCGEEIESDFKTLISVAEKVKIIHNNLNWHDWERYSSRQETKMKLGGFIGEITYQGNFQPFLPLILLGEYTHIGKNTTFGLGKYKIIKEERNVQKQ